MDKCNSIEHDFHKNPNMYPNLNANISNEQQLGLNKIIEINDYLLAEFRETELISKNLSNHFACFEYFSKSLISLSVVASSISIVWFATFIGAPAGILGAICGFTFPITSGFVKKVFKSNKK